MAGPELSDELTARVVLALASDFPLWVRRRVETVTFIADVTVRRQMSVDLVLPPRSMPPFDRVDIGSMVWVPIWLPPKEPMTHFNVWDEQGTVLSILNTRENGGISARALTLMLGDVGHELTDAQRRDVVEIATSDAAKARRELARAAADWLDKVVPPGSRGRAVMNDLASAFLLLVPLRYEPGLHRVIKWATDEPLTWWGDESRPAKAVASLGLRDKAQRLGDLAIGLSESYHVELVAPEDVVIADAAMVADQWDPELGDVRSVVSIAEQRERAHLFVTTKAGSGRTADARGDRGIVLFTLRPRRTYAFAGLFVTSALITAMLAIVRWRVLWLDTTNTTALLLALPALVAAFLARPGEHVLASRLLTGVRFLGVVAAICSVVAGGFIAGGFLQPQSAVRTARACPSHALRVECRNVRRRVLVAPADGWLRLVEVLFGVSGGCTLLLYSGLAAPRALDRRREDRRARLVAPSLEGP